MNPQKLKQKVIFHRVIAVLMALTIVYMGMGNMSMSDTIKQLQADKQKAQDNYARCESDIVQGTCLTFSGLGRR